MTLIDNSKNLPGYVILFPKLCFHIQNRTVDKTASRVTKTINIVYFVFRFVMILNAAFIGFVHVANVFSDNFVINKKEQVYDKIDEKKWP